MEKQIKSFEDWVNSGWKEYVEIPEGSSFLDRLKIAYETANDPISNINWSDKKYKIKKKWLRNIDSDEKFKNEIVPKEVIKFMIDRGIEDAKMISTKKLFSLNGYNKYFDELF